MRRIAPLLLLAACGGGPPVPDVDLLLRVTSPEREVALGAAFPVEVERVWRRGLEPRPWNARALAPLAVTLESRTEREDGDRVAETFRYRAYAFSLDDVAVPAPALVASPEGGGDERTVKGDALRLRVRRALDPSAPGAPELPGPPPAAPFPWGIAAAALAVALAAAVLVARRLRRPAPAPEPAAPGPPPASPAQRALARLAVLREGDAARAYVEASSVVRDYLDERFSVPADRRTTQELLTQGALDARARALLADVLVPCDLVKFAARAAGEADRAALLDAAGTFVKETAA